MTVCGEEVTLQIQGEQMYITLLLACQPPHADYTAAPSPATTTLTDTATVIDGPPDIILYWTDQSLILDIVGRDSSYMFGLASTAGDMDLITWTGEDCLYGWYNEWNDTVVLHCHPLHNGRNEFRTDALTQDLDPATETWFGIGDYLNPTIHLSYAVWNSDESDCWTWGATYYHDVCELRDTPSP